jgi:hypothetical protein
MPTYEVEVDGRTLEVDAPTPRAAKIAVDKMRFDAGVRSDVAQKDSVFNAWVQGGPSRVKKGLKRVFGGDSTLDDRAGGLADVAIGGGLTALPMVAPELLGTVVAAPTATALAVAGGAVGAPIASKLARDVGAGEGVQELAGVVGGAGGGYAGAKVGQAVGRTASDMGRNAGEWLYRKAGFTGTELDARAAMQAVARGQQAPATTARGVLERDVAGAPTEIGAQLLNRLDTVHQRLLNSAGRRQVTTIPNRTRVADTLEAIAADLEHLPYAGAEITPEARRLADVIRTSPAPLASDVLKAKILLDRARLSSSYKLDPSLSAKQSELARASDDVRASFHGADSQLSALLSDESASLRGLDAMIAKAVKDGNRALVQFLDPMMATAGTMVAGPSGLAAPLIKRGMSSTSLMTRLGRSLYRAGGGQTVAMPEEAAMLPNAGLLPPPPPSVVTIPTGPTPPSAGMGQMTVPAAVTQKINSQRYRPTQGTEPVRAVPIYGGMPARGTDIPVPETRGAGVLRMNPDMARRELARVSNRIAELSGQSRLSDRDREELDVLRAWVDRITRPALPTR